MSEVIEMTPRNGKLFNEGEAFGYTYSATVADGEESDAVLINPSRGQVRGSVTLIAGSNTGNIYATISTQEEIEADTAVWVQWATGETTGTVQDSFIAPITALKCTSTSGEVSFEVQI